MIYSTIDNFRTDFFIFLNKNYISHLICHSHECTVLKHETSAVRRTSVFEDEVLPVSFTAVGNMLGGIKLFFCYFFLFIQLKNLKQFDIIRKSPTYILIKVLLFCLSRYYMDYKIQKYFILYTYVSSHVTFYVIYHEDKVL